METQLAEIVSLMNQIIYLMQVLLIGVCFNSAFVFCLFLLHAKNQRDLL